MPTPFRLIAKKVATGQESVVTGEFDDDEWRRLVRFAGHAEALRETEFFRRGGTYKWQISFDNGQLSAGPSLPPDAHTRELLHVLRPLILERESSFVPGVLNVLARRMNDGTVRGRLGQLRDKFLARTSQSQVVVQVGDLTINSDEALDLWLNAFEYHRDEEKQRRLEDLHPEIPFEFSKGIMIGVLLDKAHAALAVASLIRDIEHSPTARAGRDAPGDAAT